jgi:hypothetical protein
MLEYTANDVLYLQKVHSIIKGLCESGTYTNLNYEIIMDECSRYLNYTQINLPIKNFNKMNIQKDKELEGLLK